MNLISRFFIPIKRPPLILVFFSIFLSIGCLFLLFFQISKVFDVRDNSISSEGYITSHYYHEDGRDIFTGDYEIKYFYNGKSYRTHMNLSLHHDVGDQIKLEISTIDPHRVYSPSENIYFLEIFLFILFSFNLAGFFIHAYWFTDYTESSSFDITSSTPSSH
ncbi:MAG: hypothetical protein ACD_28C00138G0002 [uncultured bacterium]|nr:MAG: hypothetical protein ACD_28C00138G0002 [uncultured bacterium]KKT75277.1 MAG: hypothetical protein UW70_C0036G0001 [Candidatus Peregrinibacteria bacterium GW2011_GWA2_44_7]